MSYVAEERKKHTVYPPAEHVFTWTQMCDIQDVGFKFDEQDNRVLTPTFLFGVLSGMTTHAKKINHIYFLISVKGKYFSGDYNGINI